MVSENPRFFAALSNYESSILQELYPEIVKILQLNKISEEVCVPDNSVEEYSDQNQHHD
jgi:hypothetical protein